MNIVKLPIKENQYFQGVYQKKFIILHHTAGGSAASSIGGWAANPARIATPYVIDRDGTIYECYDPKFWAYSLGVTGGTSIEKASIPIEIASYGALAIAKQDDDKGLFKTGDAITYVGRKMNPEKIVVTQPFRPIVNPFFKNQAVKEKSDYFATHWEAYTTAQIAALKELLPYLIKRFGITLQSDRTNFLEYKDPFKLTPGIYSHTTVRKDKIDIFPQKEIIDLVAGL